MNLRRMVGRIALAAFAMSLTIEFVPPGAGASQDAPAIVAQAGGTEPRDLEPRYRPVPPPQESGYNSSYIFGMTRGVANSTIHPAGKVPLFLLTVPLDFVLFPFAAIGGLFG